MNNRLHPSARLYDRTQGFTLVELAIVLIIVGLLIGGLIISLSAQHDTANIKETQLRLAQAQEALLGFAVANGRLPCPATTGDGFETFCTNGTGACGLLTHTVQTHGRCANYYDGFLPAASLGLTPTDSNGRLVDAWMAPIRYGVTAQYDGPHTLYSFTAPNGMKTTTLATLAPDLQICATSATIVNQGTSTAQCNTDGTTNTLSNNAAAVIYSLGKNGASGGTDTDEQHNPNPNSPLSADRAYISTATSTFDDIVVWLSPNILYNRMIAAGRLP